MKLEVYGHAAWDGGNKGIVQLRNPSDQPQIFSLDLRSALELSPSTEGTFIGKEAFSTNQASRKWQPGERVVLTLRPFQVLTIDLRRE